MIITSTILIDNSNHNYNNNNNNNSNNNNANNNKNKLKASEISFAVWLCVLWVPLAMIMLEILATCGIVLAMSSTMTLNEVLTTCDIFQG